MLEKEADERGKDIEASIYRRKKQSIVEFIESISRQEKAIYQDIYTAMKLHYICGYTFRQTANKMNCGEATVARYIKRGDELAKRYNDSV